MTFHSECAISTYVISYLQWVYVDVLGAIEPVYRMALALSSVLLFALPYALRWLRTADIVCTLYYQHNSYVERLYVQAEASWWLRVVGRHVGAQHLGVLREEASN